MTGSTTSCLFRQRATRRYSHVAVHGPTEDGTATPNASMAPILLLGGMTLLIAGAVDGILSKGDAGQGRRLLLRLFGVVGAGFGRGQGRGQFG